MNNLGERQSRTTLDLRNALFFSLNQHSAYKKRRETQQHTHTKSGNWSPAAADAPENYIYYQQHTIFRETLVRRAPEPVHQLTHPFVQKPCFSRAWLYNYKRSSRESPLYTLSITSCSDLWQSGSNKKSAWTPFCLSGGSTSTATESHCLLPMLSVIGLLLCAATTHHRGAAHNQCRSSPKASKRLLNVWWPKALESQTQTTTL